MAILEKMGIFGWKTACPLILNDNCPKSRYSSRLQPIRRYRVKFSFGKSGFIPNGYPNPLMHKANFGIILYLEQLKSAAALVGGLVPEPARLFVFVPLSGSGTTPTTRGGD